MSYIGRGTESISNVEVLDNLTFNGSASYTLQKSSTNFVPSSANNLLISISGVVQQGNFSVSGSTITFDTTVSASDTCDWILHYGTGLITTVADGAITEAKLGNGAVTNAKLANSSVTVNGTSIALGGSETITAGKIGQVLQGTKTDRFSLSASGWNQVTGLDVSITPSSTSSKILVRANMGWGMNSGTTLMFRIARGTADTIFIGDTAGNRERVTQRVSPNSNFWSFPVSLEYLDSPNTTSSINYRIYAKHNGGVIATLNGGYTDNNDTSNDNSRSASSITVMEVLA